MANNFFLSQDPLLYQAPFTQPSRMNDADADLQRQYNDTMQQYKYYQQQQHNQLQNNNNGSYDYVSDLDKGMKDLTDDMKQALMANGEYAALNGQLTEIVQKELMATIKWRINSNNVAIQNINRQLEIINSLKRDMEDEQRKNMSELNDYVRNYSNITFDEYKRIKYNEGRDSNNVSNSVSANNVSSNNNNKKTTKK